MPFRTRAQATEYHRALGALEAAHAALQHATMKIDVLNDPRLSRDTTKALRGYTRELTRDLRRIIAGEAGPIGETLAVALILADPK